MARARYSGDSELDKLTSGNVGHYDSETNTWVDTDENGNTHAELTEAYTEKMNRLNAVSGVYQRLNRIITGDEVTVKVISDPDMDTNARSNGVDVELNGDLIEDVTDESILSLHGLNYHELAHVQYSPRIGSNLGQYITENKLFRACAIAEEARTEQLLLAKYSSIRPYLESSLYTYLLSKPTSEWGGIFHLVTGRTYLPVELRQIVSDKAIAYYGIDTVREVHDIIHTYRNLVFPTQFDEAKALLVRLANIVGYDEEPKGKDGWQQGGCNGGLPKKGRPESAKEQDKLQNSRPQDNLENLQGGTSEDKGDKQAPENSAPTQTPDQADQEQDSKDKAIAEALNKRINDIKNEKNVKRDISDIRKAIIDSDVAKADIVSASYQELPPSLESLSTSKRFATELERIVRNNDPAWLTRVRSGRLNVQRTMNPDINAISEAFDQWDIGNESTDIEAVILTDNSGSMGGSMTKVCENTWIIKRGIESINGNVSVFSFDTDTEVLYNSADKAKPRSVRVIKSKGWTNPLRGLIEANRILTSSKKSIKILFVVTDGEWDKEEACDSLIKEMNDKGFLTSVVFISNYKTYQDVLDNAQKGEEYAVNHLKRIKHGAQVFHAVFDTKDLLKVASNLVKSTLKKVA